MPALFDCSTSQVECLPDLLRWIVLELIGTEYVVKFYCEISDTYLLTRNINSKNIRQKYCAFTEHTENDIYIKLIKFWLV